MAPKGLPAISGKQAVQALLRLGFKIDRIRGSHHVLLHDGPPVRAVSVPVHGSKPMARGTLHDIVKKSGFAVEAFIAELRACIPWPGADEVVADVSHDAIPSNTWPGLRGPQLAV